MAGIEDESWLRVGVAQAMLQSAAGDSSGHLASLASMFRSALPQQSELLYSGFIKKKLSGVILDLQGYRYQIKLRDNGSFEASRQQVSRGITLGREELTVAKWVEEVTLALEVEAQTNAAAATALQSWIS